MNCLLLLLGRTLILDTMFDYIGFSTSLHRLPASSVGAGGGDLCRCNSAPRLSMKIKKHSKLLKRSMHSLILSCQTMEKHSKLLDVTFGRMIPIV